MATPAIKPLSELSGHIPLTEIDAIVSARLGPTRVPGNGQPACFNRQMAMYLAARFAGWSTTAIGKFYNGRDHSTVCYGIQRIEALRESDPEVDTLVTELKQNLAQSSRGPSQPRTESAPALEGRTRGLSAWEVEAIAERVAIRVLERLRTIR